MLPLTPNAPKTGGDLKVADGGQDYPEKILREDHRNIRVWLQDGSNDQENPK
jgi:hypothetical protein